MHVFHPFFLSVQWLCLVKVLLAQTGWKNELYSQAQVLRGNFFFFSLSEHLHELCKCIYPQQVYIVYTQCKCIYAQQWQ